MTPHLILLLFVSSPAWSLNRQDRIEYSALKMYEQQEPRSNSVVPVENGYLISNSKLQSYVEIKDEKWNAEADGKPVNPSASFSRIKSFFTDFLNLKNHAKQAEENAVNEEALKKLRLRHESSVKLGQELKSAVTNYQNGNLVKVQSLKTCSDSLVSISGTLQDQPFEISVTSSKTQPFQQTANLKTHDFMAHETEEFEQIGGFRLGVYQTARSKILNGKIQESVDPKLKLIDTFAAKVSKAKALSKSKSEDFKNSVTQAWRLSKKLAGCCANQTCRNAFQSRQSHPGQGGLRPYQSHQ